MAKVWKSEAVLTAIGKATPAECITEARLVDLTGFDPRSIENCCMKLRRHGLLTKTDRGCHKLTPSGRAAAAEGVKLRSGPQGPRNGRVVRLGTVRDRAWHAMRIKRKFCIDDLVMLVAEGSERDIESNIGKYVHALARAGYVRQLRVREAGLSLTSNGCVRWLLLRDSGPKPPIWRVGRNTVYDPNNEEDIPLADEIERASRRRPRGEASCG